MMKVAVFGGSGFIGSHLADELTERGHSVKVIGRHHSPYLREGQEMVIADILDEKKVDKAVKGCDIVYNLAGLADIEEASIKPAETVKYNILGNVNVMNACVKHKVKRFVYASTLYVYSDLGGFYRCSKQASEAYVEEFNRVYGLNFTILRYGTVYGPRADEKNSVYRYLKQAIDKKKIVCVGTGDELREYVHVKDVAKLSVDILDDKFKNDYVILTGHHPMRYRDLMYTIQEILKKQKVVLEFKQKGKSNPHYNITPYSYTPRIGKKLVSNHYIDIGQGLLECIEEIYKKEGKKND